MSNTVDTSRNELLSSLTTIVSSYLNQNPIAPEKVPDFIGAVSRALRQAQDTPAPEPTEVSEARASSPTAYAASSPWTPSLATSSQATPSEEPLRKPAVPIDESVTDDYIVC